MLARGFGASKEAVGWTDEDEKVLESLIPDPEKLMAALKHVKMSKKEIKEFEQSLPKFKKHKEPGSY